MTPSRIILIGFMGSGKTTLGPQLARQLGYTFIDLDECIEQSCGLPVPEIFSSKGEDWFRKAERACLLESLKGEHMVLSAGGGTPCYADHMALMREAGFTVYLRCRPDTLYARLRSAGGSRPLLKGLSGEELKNYIVRLLGEREAFYLQSALILEADSLGPEEFYDSLRTAAGSGS